MENTNIAQLESELARMRAAAAIDETRRRLLEMEVAELREAVSHTAQTLAAALQVNASLKARLHQLLQASDSLLGWVDGIATEEQLDAKDGRERVAKLRQLFSSLNG